MLAILSEDNVGLFCPYKEIFSMLLLTSACGHPIGPIAFVEETNIFPWVVSCVPLKISYSITSVFVNTFFDEVF